jgi:hypothetical protein
MTMFQNLHRSMTSGQSLKIRCEACDHQTTLTHCEAVKRCGPDSTPMDIRRRAKCKACGVEGRARVWI